MLKVFIGYDEKEPIAYHVLAHSILKRSSEPVAIIPLNRDNLRSCFWRPRGELDSTDFSNSRWIVPHLCGYKGMAVFMDCDMLCRGDISEITRFISHPERDAVACVKHAHVPTAETKFLDLPQTKYMRKNWSSVMVFNNDQCGMLTKHIVNTMTPALWFHQFNWVEDEKIASLPPDWNLLVGYDEYCKDAKIVHFTEGGPWHGYNDVDYADEWWDEYNAMMQGGNPVNYLELRNARPDSVLVRDEDEQQAAE